MKYAVFHTQFLGSVGIPSSMLDKLLQCAYLVETDYHGTPPYSLTKASPLTNQRFHSATGQQMREISGDCHKSKEAFVVVLETARAFAVPAKIISEVINKCYLFEMSYATGDDERSVYKLGHYIVQSVQPLSNISFEIHDLADIKACQAQEVLSSSN